MSLYSYVTCPSVFAPEMYTGPRSSYILVTFPLAHRAYMYNQEPGLYIEVDEMYNS
jgi:hypothetical protein